MRCGSESFKRHKEWLLRRFDSPDLCGEDGGAKHGCNPTGLQLTVPVLRWCPYIADDCDGAFFCHRSNRTGCPSRHLANFMSGNGLGDQPSLARGDLGVAGNEILQRRKAFPQAGVLIVAQKCGIARTHGGLHCRRRELCATHCAIACVVVLPGAKPVTAKHEGAVHVEKNGSVVFYGRGVGWWHRLCLVSASSALGGVSQPDDVLAFVAIGHDLPSP